MSLVIAKGQIGNALESIAPEHVVAVAEDIYDEGLGLYQHDINTASAGIFTDPVWVRGEGSGSATLKPEIQWIVGPAHPPLSITGEANATTYQFTCVAPISYWLDLEMSIDNGAHTAKIVSSSGSTSGTITVSSTLSEVSVSNTEVKYKENYSSTARGKFAVAEGFITTASGDYSHAEGNNTKASGSYSHAEGNSTKASGNWSHAEGLGTEASGIYSHTEGNGTKASGYTSHAEGYSTTALGDYSHTEGDDTTASGRVSHAEGESTVASGHGSHAEGQITEASGYTSHAEGDSTLASGYGSHAEGLGTVASNNYEHAQGKYNATASGQIFSIGVGTSNGDKRNAISIITSSNYSASVYIYGVGGYSGSNGVQGVNDVSTVLSLDPLTEADFDYIYDKLSSASVIAFDDYPEEILQEVLEQYEVNDLQELAEFAKRDPGCTGENVLTFTGDYLEYQGNEYQLWEGVIEGAGGEENILGLLENGTDFNSLYSASLEANSENKYCPFVALSFGVENWGEGDIYSRDNDTYRLLYVL